MKTKYIFFITILLYIVEVYSQNKKQKILVEYEAKKGRLTSNEFLISDGINAFYTSDFLNYNNKENITQENEEGTYSIEQENIKINKMEYYTTLNSNILHFISFEQRQQNTIIAIDTLPDLNWKISYSDKKIIQNLECYMAKTIFRGSSIIAYFTTSIPVPFGPFKFKNLPGLILEVFNNDLFGQKFHWKAKKINLNYLGNKEISFNMHNYKNYEIVSYRSIIEDFDNKMEEISKKILSTAPRGSSTKLLKKQRSSIEKKYEWEEN